ncbi:N-acetylmuramoyl-L-alanine amidase [Desulfobaculum xiamenense]|uniref:N-acetylmuramoyl-L-alanine amidase n=1 Tax=Desulfobaculum xiamenense TaxID=995050 RepID=A0A846QMI1_9BACT|nr:N-acetylmuramoyl-L-alanine amidase [Desulfobaculum xiamenense]NJB66635.1 N-acetylmuramoyl-L-alanine amidase [Desulfobaculum xiamenense]
MRDDRRRVLRGLAVAGMWAFSRPIAASWGASSVPTPLDMGLRAQDALESGDVVAAVDILEQAVRAAPNEPWLWGLLGRAHMAGDDFARAGQAFRRALTLEPTDTYSRMMLDMLSQRPAGVQGDMPGTPGDAPLSELELRAQAERREFLESSRTHEGTGRGAFRVNRIMLDPGHGGFDSGAVGPGGLKEKDVALDVALRIRSIMMHDASGPEVLLTRSADHFLPLSARTAAANRVGADIFVSLHVNAGERRGARGVETYSCSEAASGREAARLALYENSVVRFEEEDGPRRFLELEDILFRFERRRYWAVSAAAASRMQMTLAEALPWPDRGTHSADFFVLRKVRMPALLLETGFISNPDEERLLRDSAVRQRIAQAVADGLFAMHGSGIGA